MVAACEDCQKLRDWLSIVDESLRYIKIGLINLEGTGNDYKMRGHRSAQQLQLLLREKIQKRIKDLEPLPSRRLEAILNEE